MGGGGGGVGKAWKRKVGTNASKETHHLVCQEQNCLETKFAGTEVEEIFQAGPQELHHHHIIVPLCSTPLNGGDTHWGKRKIKPTEQRKTAAPLLRTSCVTPNHFLSKALQNNLLLQPLPSPILSSPSHLLPASSCRTCFQCGAGDAWF